MLWLVCMHTLPCIRVVLEVTRSFSASSCFLMFLTKNLSLVSAAPFCWCHFPWVLLPVLGLMNVSFTSSRSLFRLAHGSLYTLYVQGPVLASWPPGTTSTPVNILLAAHPDMHIGESLSLPGNSEARNYPGHSQNNIQSSQEWTDPWLFQTRCNAHELMLRKWIAHWAIRWGALEWLESLT